MHLLFACHKDLSSFLKIIWILHRKYNYLAQAHLHVKCITKTSITAITVSILYWFLRCTFLFILFIYHKHSLINRAHRECKNQNYHLSPSWSLDENTKYKTWFAFCCQSISMHQQSTQIVNWVRSCILGWAGLWYFIGIHIVIPNFSACGPWTSKLRKDILDSQIHEH